MLTETQINNVMTAVEQGSGLRDALRQHAGVELTDKLRDWLLENHHVSYLDAKRKAQEAKV